MKLKWQKNKNLLYYAKCGIFDAWIYHYADSRINNCPQVTWHIYLNDRISFKSGFCNSVAGCKRAVEEAIESEVYRIIDEAGMNDILDGG